MDPSVLNGMSILAQSKFPTSISVGLYSSFLSYFNQSLKTVCNCGFGQLVTSITDDITKPSLKHTKVGLHAPIGI